ncbi:MAG: class I SAM-dependent methyltransferase [bacterium]
MPRTRPFEEHAGRYEAWFDRHQEAFRSELAALRSIQGGPPILGVEIGVGSARFARPLGFQVGVEPALAMARIAARKGIVTVRGIAERLPLRTGTFDQALMVTTICFVDDLLQSFLEVRRVLASRGTVLVGLIDRESPIGQVYEEKRSENVFYRDADFYVAREVLGLLSEAGFGDPVTAQTLFSLPGASEGTEPVRTGYGEGSFVAIAARRLD